MSRIKLCTKRALSLALTAALLGSVSAVSAATVSAYDYSDMDFDLSGHTVGICGTFGTWIEDTAQMTDADGDGVYLGVVKDVEPDYYEYKVRLDDSWLYSWGTYDSNLGATYNSQVNCGIDVSEKADVIVAFDTNGEDYSYWLINGFALYNKGGDAEHFDPSKHTFGVIGGFNDWNDDVSMTELTDGIYYANIGDVGAGTEFKIRADKSWDYSWSSYESDYDRTENSNINCEILDDAKNLTVFLNTNGDDYNLWNVSYLYTSSEGYFTYYDTGKEDGPEYDDPWYEPEPSSDVSYDNYFGVTEEGIEWERYYDYDREYYCDEIQITGYDGKGGNVNIPSEIDGSPVTIIGSGAFSYCSNITGVTIPTDVKCISDSAFEYCTKLKNITIPDSVTDIYDCAFEGCTGLTEITIPASVTFIDSTSFDGCTKLTKIDVSSNNEEYSTQDGVLFDKNKYTLLRFPEGKTGAYSIPSGVTDVYYNSFKNCKSLTSVSVPDSVTYLDTETFNGCTKLTKIDVSSNNGEYSRRTEYYLISISTLC